MFNRTLLKALLIAVVFSAPALEAMAKEAGDFLVRARGLHVVTNTAGTTDALGGDVRTSDPTVPELDFTYFWSKNIATELILAVTKHDAKLANSPNGDLDLGEVKLLPPTLTMQYHFRPEKAWSPYIGAGINYTVTFDERDGRNIDSITYSNEFGWALQAGFDYAITDKVSFNFDVKYIRLETDIRINGGAINANSTNLDPIIIGAGFGYKF